MTRRRKPKVGGRRKGAGRPRLGPSKRSEEVKVRLTPAELAAVKAVAASETDAIDGKPATPATWFRDRGLERLGILPGKTEPTTSDD